MLLKRSKSQKECKASHSAKHRQKGFTLVEISISIIVIGLLIAPLFRLYDTYLVEKSIRETQMALQSVVSEMEAYRDIQGSYPCPAPMTAARTSATNGAAMNADDCSAAYFASIPQVVGECLDGICLKSSVRVGASDIIVGTVPFRNLQMTEKDVLDGYGNRLLYAVTQSLTDITTFNSEEGGVSIIDTAGNELVPNNDTMFLLLSYGSSRDGAYNKNGLQGQACPTSGPETDNCIADFASSTIPVDAVFTYAPVTNAGGANDFDHQMHFYSTGEEKLWRRYSGEEQHAQDMAPDNQIGIGTDTPSATLDIYTEQVGLQNVASVIVNSGELIAPELCDETGTYCFEPKLLAGDVDGTAPVANQGGMTCPDGEYLVGIDGASPLCEPHRIECPPSTPIFNGFTAGGAMICDPIPGNSCAALTKVVCASVPAGTESQILLPESADGTPSVGDLRDYGSCAKAGYTCNEGTWNPMGGNTASASTCNFVAPPPVVVTGISCGPSNQYGDQTYDSVTTETCLGGPSTSPKACICGEDELGVPLPPEYAYSSCSALYSKSSAKPGAILFDDGVGGFHERRKTRTWTGTSSCSAVDSWNNDNCICAVPDVGLVLKDVPGTKWPTGTYANMPARWIANGSCPSGTSGTRYRLQYFHTSISQCSWRWTSAFYKYECDCDGTDGDLWDEPQSCGPGTWLPGSEKIQPKIFDAGICAFTNNGSLIDNCTCDTTPIIGTQDHACANPVCDVADPLDKDTTSTPMNPGTCAPDTAGKTITSLGSCKPRTFIWDRKRSLAGHADTPPGSPVYVDKTCGCAQLGQKTTCYNEGDDTWKRQECECKLSGG
jgi:prepilin-type N-terminal cleavage/methylation domain-containing protein